MTFITTRGTCVALAAALAGAALTACVPAALVGGAVGAGVLLSSADRRSGETQQADQAIETAARDGVVQALNGRGHVTVSSYYRKALITGEVPSAQDKQMVETYVRGLPGVQGVVNELAVMPESTTLQRSNDAFITSKVRGRLVGSNGVPAGSVKVLTERGTTYLMGRLTAQELAVTTDVISRTDGVQRVVRVVDLIADPMMGTGNTTVGTTAPAAQLPGTAVNAGESVPGVVTQPVTQPTIVQQPAVKTIEVQTLPPVK